MTDLTLSVNERWLNDIRSGVKLEEYREVKGYWTKRLVGKTYDRVVVTCGYPKADEHDKRIVLAWRGFRRMWLSHEHFQTFWPIEVYAIDVSVRYG